MSKLRWAKLWWSDYENDPALRLCSLAAQGLWMRLLCLAASSRVYGHVLVAGQPPTIVEIARIVGARPDQVRRLLAELDSHQVFEKVSPDSRQTLARHDVASLNFVIVSRRMVNDYAEHIRKFDAGRQGGNPILVNQPDNQEGNHVAQTQNPIPPKAPRGGRRTERPDFRNGMSESLNAEITEERDHADDRTNPPVARPALVAVAGRPVRH